MSVAWVGDASTFRTWLAQDRPGDGDHPGEGTTRVKGPPGEGPPEGRGVEAWMVSA